MTIEDRLRQLERMIGTVDDADARRREEAVREATKRLVAAVNHLAAGGEPNCKMHHILAEARSAEEFAAMLREAAAETRAIILAARQRH